MAKKRSALERHLEKLAKKHGVEMHDEHIDEARRLARSFMAEASANGHRIGPREAVEDAEVYVFRIYGLPRKSAG